MEKNEMGAYRLKWQLKLKSHDPTNMGTKYERATFYTSSYSQG